MKRVLACVVAMVVCQSPAMGQGREIDLGVSVSDGKLRDFYFAVGDYYHAPPIHVVELRDRYRCQDEELPVAYFLAARAHVTPEAVFSLRIQKMSWLDIAFHFRLTPDIFFVPVRAEPVGPPYGNAYGYYRKYGATREWKRMALTDHDVVALVNLRFVSDYHGMPPETVMGMRGRQASFVAINDEIRRGKAEKANQKSKSKPKKK
jgi:hypothetical protein